MKNLTVSPLRLLIVISALLFTGSSLHAGASNKDGNPYGNGSLYSNTGTFNGVLRGVNIVGVTQFSTSTNTTLSGGPLYIYNAATGFYDDSWAVYPTINVSGNSLTAFMASANNPNNQITNNAGGSTLNPIQTPLGAGGSFSASLNMVPPNQTYSGNGDINLTGKSQVFTINGMRIGD